MVKFFYYDLVFLIAFSLFVVHFLYKRRSNLKREGIMYLYRTQVGIKFINYVGDKYKKTLKVLSYVSIFCGYILMGTMIYLLGLLVYTYIANPEIVRAIKVPPLMPLVPYLPSLFKIDFLPPFYFTYWIVSIAIIAIFHEFAHGIFARRHGIEIKTTGFGFLGPFLAAFVEPDEEQMQKKSKFAQLSVLSAGTFVNLILAILFFLLLSVFFIMTYVPAGAMFNTYTPGIVKINEINRIDGLNVINPTNQGLIDIIDEGNLSEDLILENGVQLNLTKVVANGDGYFITLDNLKEQLESESDYVALYQDLPAIRAGLKGVIIGVDGKEIKTHEDLSEAMKGYSPGESVKIETKFEEEILSYDLVLAEDPNNGGRAVMGIGVIGQKGGVIGRVSDFFNFFKKTATHYEPRFDSNFMIFVYNLIWWIALINISIALVNMLPVGIFDGGRMFMLTIWGITKSEKFGQLMFKIMTYAILIIVLLLMVGWFGAVF